MVMAPFKIKENFLPFLSATQELKKQPTKHPACRMDAMLAERSACWTLSSLSRPYFLPRLAEFVERLLTP
jgi:hypothetical protein